MIKIVMLITVLALFLVIIRYLHNNHVRVEKYTNISPTEKVSNSILNSKSVEPKYIEVTDTVFVEPPNVPVKKITCNPQADSFDKINVDTINKLNTSHENNTIDFMTDVNINGTLNVNEIKMNNRTLFTYDSASNTLRI